MEHMLEKLYVLSEHDRGLFSKAINTFFSSTFIIKQLQRDKELYRFVLANYTLFEAYLDVAGWHLRKDESIGVISCEGPPSGKISLNLEETCSLLVFRLLYEEKQMEIQLSGENIVRQFEFHEKYKALTERTINKTRMREILRRFKSLKLINVRGEETEPDTIIVLHPSLVFALDGESIDETYNRIEKLTGAVQENEDE